MKASDTNIASGVPVSPPAFGAGRGADRMPVVQTVSVAAMCMQIIDFGMNDALAVADGSLVPTASSGSGGPNKILKKQVGRIERESSGTPGEKGA